MEVWELKLYFYPSAGGVKKKKEKKKGALGSCGVCERGGPGVSCSSLQFTAAAQCTATAEEATAQLVSVRQQQGARALVGWAVFGQVRGLV